MMVAHSAPIGFIKVQHGAAEQFSATVRGECERERERGWDLFVPKMVVEKLADLIKKTSSSDWTSGDFD